MSEANPNSRLEAFCDGVFAIALTLLIIDIRIPVTESINTDNDLWLALRHLSASIMAFLLSFVVILITWVNHHEAIKLVNKSSPKFIYANAFLLLTVVFTPFPTSLLGEHILTAHAAPAVVLYGAVNALAAISWMLLHRSALNPAHRLTKSEYATRQVRGLLKNAYYAFFFYTTCSIIAFWFPKTIAIIIGISWIAWLILSISIKTEHEQ